MLTLLNELMRQNISFWIQDVVDLLVSQFLLPKLLQCHQKEPECARHVYHVLHTLMTRLPDTLKGQLLRKLKEFTAKELPWKYKLIFDILIRLHAIHREMIRNCLNEICLQVTRTEEESGNRNGALR